MKNKWTYEMCKEEASKYTNRKSLQESNQYVYNLCRKNNWLDEFFGEVFRWNYDLCKKESAKYDSKNSFQKGNSSAYSASLKNGWLDEFYPKKTIHK